MDFSQFSGLNNIQPEQAMKFAVQNLFSFFGGVKNFDMWATQTADFLAHAPMVPSHVSEMGLVKILPDHEIVDFVLETMELLAKWDYRIHIKFLDGVAMVTVSDSVWGHQIENVEIPYTDPVKIVEQYSTKYGPNAKITQNITLPSVG